MKNLFKFICCGNVDDGKSTLIGRLLLDTNNVKKDQLTDALKASERNGSDKIELAMLLDGLLAEREQQITIDIAHRFFDYQDTRFHILDCPGHEQYTKNMAIAAAEADTAIVVIDITKGIKPQTLKHIEICSLFHIKNLLICLTKADLITWAGEVDENKLLPLKQEIESVLKKQVLLAKQVTAGVSGDEQVLSPGMKYKHYAPNAKVVIVKGSLKDFVNYVSLHKKQNTFVMCFEGEENLMPVKAISYGKKDEPKAQAHNLFSILRFLHF